jgi:hypothetical protein
MLLQTNSYIVPQDKRAEHARLMRRFRHALHQVGCDNFEVYEQVGANWGGNTTTGRFVQIMRFRDRRHQQAVQAAERNDPAAQQLIAEFCELINYPQQQQQQQFVVGFYSSALPVAPPLHRSEEETPAEDDAMAEVTVADTEPAQSAQAADTSDELHAVDLDESDAHEEPVAATEETPAEEPEHELDQAEPEETVLDETPAPESSEDVLESAGEMPEEDLFADDSDALAEAETEEIPTEEPASEPVSEPQPSDDSAEAELESEPMQADDEDDISRLAEELAADDEEQGHSRHPDSTLHGRGRASGNGAH